MSALTLDIVSASPTEDFDAVYAQARQIIKQTWLDAGMSEAEWERSDRILKIMEFMPLDERSDKEVGKYLQQATEEELTRLERQYLPKE